LLGAGEERAPADEIRERRMDKWSPGTLLDREVAEWRKRGPRQGGEPGIGVPGTDLEG
jgi:hypothetical protein